VLCPGVACSLRLCIGFVWMAVLAWMRGESSLSWLGWLSGACV
jgi:hypothetical protein